MSTSEGESTAEARALAGDCNAFDKSNRGGGRFEEGASSRLRRREKRVVTRCLPAAAATAQRDPHSGKITEVRRKTVKTLGFVKH